MHERDDTPSSKAPGDDLPNEAPVEGPPPSEAPTKKFTSRFGISREMTDEEVEDLLAGR
jgi:hypothetical protein